MRRTKPENTEHIRAQKRATALGLAVTWLIRLAGAGLLLELRTDPGMPGWMRTLFLILAVLGLLSLPFSLVSLRQRFREIEEGELDEARKY